ncbi:YgaP family membrane protein [Celeribacter neptunius]|uniref:Inner membrane protein YgaP-like transmembrane domain-containing protein n=1 Tax=Celeribacter neptunius TaxID=588602 RepID=A0A1I3WB19_9RHOB|nr:DUF2892 domain-containing protein [Celeribacter neptunius]SFK04758.1 Protein of unknown function [Celeribacter neptunius]
MSIDRAMFRFAGIMVLISVALTQFVHPGFVWFTVFIGANLLQSSFTGWCPAAKIMAKLGLPAGCAFDK